MHIQMNTTPEEELILTDLVKIAKINGQYNSKPSLISLALRISEKAMQLPDEEFKALTGLETHFETDPTKMLETFEDIKHVFKKALGVYGDVEIGISGNGKFYTLVGKSVKYYNTAKDAVSGAMDL